MLFNTQQLLLVGPSAYRRAPKIQKSLLKKLQNHPQEISDALKSPGKFWKIQPFPGKNNIEEKSTISSEKWAKISISSSICNENSSFKWTYFGSGILNDSRTPPPDFFPKTSNIAYGWENYSGSVLSGILGYF